MPSANLSALVRHSGGLVLNPVHPKRNFKQKRFALVILSFGIQDQKIQIPKRHMETASKELTHHLLLIYPERKREDIQMLAAWALSTYFYSVPESHLGEALYYLHEIDAEEIRKRSLVWAIKECLSRYVRDAGLDLLGEAQTWDERLRLARLMKEKDKLPPDHLFFIILNGLKSQHLRAL